MRQQDDNASPTDLHSHSGSLHWHFDCTRDQHESSRPEICSSGQVMLWAANAEMLSILDISDTLR